MPRPLRLDFKGAIHAVRIRGHEGADVFFAPAILRRPPREIWAHAPWVRQFLDLLAQPLDESGTTLYGYCIEPNLASLLVQTSGTPLDKFMQRVCGPFSRHWRKVSAHNVAGPFATRYESKVIAPEYAAHALRRLHARPLEAGLPRLGTHYPFSSEQEYLGGPVHAPLDTAPVVAALWEKGFVGERGYREFMNEPESPYVARLLERGSALDARIVGGRAFVAQALYLAAHPPRAPTREELISGVARLLQSSPSDIYSKTRTGVLGRSLVAWYGVRGGTATLTDIGRWFSVSAATLGHALRYYRRVTPRYFEARTLDAFYDEAGTGKAEKKDGDV